MVPHSRSLTPHLLRKFRGWPPAGQFMLTSSPVEDRVMKAVFRSAPPKQILVVIRSGMGTNAGASSATDNVVIPPSMRVATQTSPFPSTANESNIKYPERPFSRRRGLLVSITPGALRAYAQRCPVGVSATKSSFSSADKPIPLGSCMGKIASSM